MARISRSLGRERPTSADEVPPRSRFADRATTERAYLGWLGRTLVDARVGAADGAGTSSSGTPAGVRYTFDGALATALGPRDDAWLEPRIADPRVAIDITPWWADATDAQSLLNRALVPDVARRPLAPPGR